MNLKEFTEKYGNKEVEEAKLKELLGIKDSKHWKPVLGETYWYVDSFGDIYQDNWENMVGDKHRYSLGNCYKTKEEAIFARERQIFMTKLERDFAENSDEIDWRDSKQRKYNLYLSIGNVGINLQSTVSYGTPVTTDKEWLENYIKENEEEIKKYYFGKGNDYGV